MANVIKINGTIYPSCAAAGRALGCSARTVINRLDAGTLDTLPGATLHLCKPVTIRGVTYPSHRKAAEALGVTNKCITVAARRGKLDNVGLRKKR